MKKILLTFLFFQISFASSSPFLDIVDISDIFDPKNIYQFELGQTKKLVLTIDDGPTKKVTTDILDSFKLYQDFGFDVSATFFLIGRKINKDTQSILQRMKDENHIIANHTLTHPRLARLKSQDGKIDQKTALKELIHTHHTIIPYLPQLSDLDKKWYFRAPYGNWAPFLAKIYNQHEYLKYYIGPLFWNIGGEIKYKLNPQGIKYMTDAADWDCWRKKISPLQCAQGYLNAVLSKQGGVILLHDIKTNSSELIKYLLVAISGRNLFPNKKYDQILDLYPNEFSDYSFISLDEVRALDKWDNRLVNLIQD